MKRKSLLFVCLLLLALPFYAAQVDTVMVQSPSMNKEVQVVVVTPDVAFGKKAVACPVVYLLHGFGGNAKTWINTKRELPQIAEGITTSKEISVFSFKSSNTPRTITGCLRS